MNFVSTRGFSDSSLSFADVITQGLAPDGGLFLPTSFPSFSLEEITELSKQSYAQRAANVLQKFDLHIPASELLELANLAYSDFDTPEIAPVKQLNEKNAVLELFHGPTASFKDMALQLTPHLFASSLRFKNDTNHYCVLTATSGDTGIAAIEGFKKIPNTSVVVLYPKGGVSALQEKQMRSVADKNVKVLAVESDFDFCQTSVKKIFFNNKELCITKIIMKTILVDAINAFVLKDKGIFNEMYKILEQYPNRKIILTNANDDEIKKFGLNDMPYDVFTLKHDPEKTDPNYFNIMLKHFNLSTDDVVYFEHNKDAVKSAQSVGINTFHYDKDTQDLEALKKFIDESLSKLNIETKNTTLTAANSMNWGRLLPQVVYYFSAYADLVSSNAIVAGEKIEVCVPSGNFGNVLAAFLASKMGVPIAKFICASNENNALTEFLTTGTYSVANRKLLPTDSPSIDILISSNIERFLYLMNGGNASQITQWFTELSEKGSFTIDAELLEKIQQLFFAGYAVHEEMQATVRSVFTEYNYLLDPHTAVAVHVGNAIPQEYFRLTAATAHYQKFAPAMMAAFQEPFSTISASFEYLQNLQSSVPAHSSLSSLLEKPMVQNTEIAGEYESIVKNIEDFLFSSKA